MTSFTCKEEGCPKKRVAQGYCREHYDSHRKLGHLKVVSGSYKPGRPAGAVRSGELEKDWKSMDIPSRREVQDAAKKRMLAILESDGSNQAEVLAICRIAGSWDEKGSDDAKRRELMGLVQQVRGEPGD